MSNVTLHPHAPLHIESPHPTEPTRPPASQAPHAPEHPQPHPPAAFTTDGFEPDAHHGPHRGVELLGGPQGEMLLAAKPPAEQNVLERVTGFFKGLGLGAAEVFQSLGQFARNVNDVNPLLIVTGTLADFIVAPIKGRSPGQVLQARSERTQEAGRALLQQTNAMMRLAQDLSPGGQRDNFFKMSKALAQDLTALSDQRQLTPGKVMEAIQRRTNQNPSVKAAQALVDSVTNYKAILSSGGSPEEIGKGAFRIFSALAPFAKAKVAGRPLPAGATAPVRPQGVTPIVSQPKPSSAAGFRGTVARVPNNAVGRAYVQAYEMAKQMASKHGGTVQGIGGSIAEGRGRLATFDRGVWTHQNAQTLDKMPISANAPLPPEAQALANKLPPGSIEAKLAGGKTIPSDLDVVVKDLPYAQQKLIKAEVFERTGVLIEFVRPSDKLPATGLRH
jgi:hypothetical protein